MLPRYQVTARGCLGVSELVDQFDDREKAVEKAEEVSEGSAAPQRVTVIDTLADWPSEPVVIWWREKPAGLEEAA